MNRVILLIVGSAAVLGQGPRDDCDRCINIYECESFMDLLRKFGSSAAGFVKDAHCGFEGKDPRVCCPDPKPQIDHNPPNPATRPVLNNQFHQQTSPLDQNNPYPQQPSFVNPNNPFLSRPTTMTTRFPEIPGLKKIDPAERSNCGYSDAEHTRIVGGIASKKGAWPWIAALGYRQPRTQRIEWKCGGTLISDRHVLTAAHCVKNQATLYSVRLGEHNLEDDNDGANPVDIRILYKTIHPGYNKFENDIAILTLESAVESTDWIHPICLPITPDIINLDMTGFHPFVAGWGTISYRGVASDVLREVQVEVQLNEVCKSSYQKLSPDAIIDGRVVCAGYKVGGKDACQGDSGGPLMLPKPDGTHYWYLIGVVSYGHRCAEPGFPGVYTKISAHLDFIYNVVTQSGGQLCNRCGKY